MVTIILISFFSGILTVLAPCVLPLLPVILWGWLAGTDRKRPYIIIASLILSLLVFTVLLKASTVLIGVDPLFWEYVAGGLLVLFSITLIFPHVWVWLMDITGIEKLSQNSLESASHREWIWWPIALGAALGPVFSSCNPTYTILLATILPASFTMGMIGLLAYFIGLGIILLLIVHFGRSIIGRFRFFSNPHGIFRRLLGIIILIVGLLIVTGYIKKIETFIIERNIFVNTFAIDNTLNEIILRNHNTVNNMCANGKCDEGREGDLMMDVARAPELTGIAAWINLPAGQAGSKPLTLEWLRWKVVLIDFWTYSCINCIRTQPYLNAWHEKYADDGLVIIGVHAPEFAFEKVENNVREASQKAGIKYPIALDNDFATWNAYDNKYWPAKYLIDQNGNIVYKHFWEGEYAETEQKIQSLLGMNNEEWIMKNGGLFNWENSSLSQGKKKTPETYLGTARAENMIFSSGKLIKGVQKFTPYPLLSTHQWTLEWEWDVQEEFLQASEPSILTLKFSAKNVFLVVSSNSERKGGMIFVQELDKDGNIISENPVRVIEDTIYQLFESEKFQDEAMIRISVTPWLRLHAFTFWS